MAHVAQRGFHTNIVSPAGKTLAENLDTCRDLDPNQTIIKPLESPVKRTGHIQILYGNISPGGCVGKITGKEGLAFEGPAKVYNSEEDMIAALSDNPQSMKVRWWSWLLRGAGAGWLAS